MAEKGDSSKAKQIKVLLGVLGSGLVAGVLIALSMLYYYNPTGSYLVKNVILDPENAYSLHYVEPGAKAKTDSRYTFEGMYFSYFDIHSKESKSIPVTKSKYAELYNLIANEKSLVEPGSHIQELFNRAYPAILSLKVRSVGDDSSKGAGSIFSRIDFVNGGDYYRIQLRQSAPGSGWVYFYHPHIYQEVMTLFNLETQ